MMADAALRQHQIGIETTPGTSVAATRKIYGKGNWGIDYDQKPVVVESSYDQRRGTIQSVNKVTGKFETPLDVRMLPEILKIAINGSPTVVQQGGTTAYLWTAAPGTLKTATWEWNDANKQWEIPYTMIDDLSIKGAIKKDEVELNLGILGKDMVEAALTSLTDFAVYPVQGWETKLYIDNIGATPGTTNIAATLISFDWKLKNNLKGQYRGDNIQAISSIARAAREVDLELTFEAKTSSDTERANWLARTQRLVRLELGNNRIIEGAYKEFVTLDIPGAWSAVVIDEDDDVTTYKAKMHNIYDTVNGWAYQVRCQNARAT